MKPLDPRLLRHAQAARRYIVLTAFGGLATTLVVIAQALLVSRAISPVITAGAPWSSALPFVAVLAGLLGLRAVMVYVQERLAHRSAQRVVSELRGSVLDRAVALGPRGLDDGHEVVTLATRGLEDLEPYFVRYLPQLLLAVTLTPLTLLVLAGLDLGSAAIVALTIPLIPVFMWLIGVLTERHAADKLAAMQRLGARLLDLLAGLSTLQALGREKGPGRRVAELGEAYRRTTMSTLRVAFLSGAVLEFLASISVALVAVTVGMRLVYGHLDLTVGLALLMLAPEAYRPLREVGTHFHASADGLAAAEQAFAVLERPVPTPGQRPAPDLATTTLRLDEVSVRPPGRHGAAPHALSGEVTPGRLTALVGPSGAGKTTTALLVLGLLPPDAGRLTLRTATGEVVDLADVDPESWHAQVSWVPQRPVLDVGTVAEVVTAGRDVDPATLAKAARATGLDEVLAELPDGLATRLGHGGVGLSLGQRQRVALARALCEDTALVVLDEPTAHLDAASERLVLATVGALRDQGRTVLVIAHRPALVAVADEVIEVRADTRAVLPTATAGAGSTGAGTTGAGTTGAER